MPNKQVSLRLDADLWRRLRLRCLEQGEAASHVVEGLIREALRPAAPAAGCPPSRRVAPPQRRGKP